MQKALTQKQTIIYIFMVAAPYFAVIIGLYLFHNAWLSIFLYHGQIVFWWLFRQKTTVFSSELPTENHSQQLPTQIKSFLDNALKGMIPISAVAGVACYFLLPYLVKDVGGLELWFANNQLTGTALLLLIPYFGIIHPPIEQAHWKSLSKLPLPFNYLSHLLFAAYHGLVLFPILQLIWIIACLLILSCISFLWAHFRQVRKNGQYLAILSHVLADIGIVTAVFLIIRN